MGPDSDIILGDHGGLTIGFVDYVLVCSSVCPILLRRVKIEQTGGTTELKSTKYSVKPETTM